MTKIEAFRCAAAEMNEATPEEMSAFIEKEFGIEIPPTYIPIFRATLRFQKSGSVHVFQKSSIEAKVGKDSW